MIHTAAPRSIRSGPLKIGIAVAGVAGALALAGCSSTPTDSAPEADTGSDESSPNATGTAGDTGTSGDSTYADGTYTADGSYATPESVETISVTVTLAGDVITAVEVTGDPQKRESVAVPGSVHRRNRRCRRRRGHRRDLGEPRRGLVAHERRLQPGDRSHQGRSRSLTHGWCGLALRRHRDALGDRDRRTARRRGARTDRASHRRVRCRVVAVPGRLAGVDARPRRWLSARPPRRGPDARCLRRALRCDAGSREPSGGRHRSSASDTTPRCRSSTAGPLRLRRTGAHG